MRFVFKTDVGKKRNNNEDSVFVKKYDDNNSLCIVADGLGGYESGEVASYLLTEIMSKFLEQRLEELKNSDDLKIKKILEEALVLANEKIFDLEKTDVKYKGMGTTIVTVLEINSKLFYISIGDSRMYHVDSKMKKINQVTIDDTYVNELIKTNVIKEEEAENHPQKHVLTKAIGILKKINVKAEILNVSDGYLVLCTDGLNNMIKEKEVLNIFKKNKFYDLADKLVDVANENGGTDNITVIVAEL